MEQELLQRVVDSALSIAILLSWVMLERREKMMLWSRLNRCLDHIEKDHVSQSRPPSG